MALGVCYRCLFPFQDNQLNFNFRFISFDYLLRRTIVTPRPFPFLYVFLSIMCLSLYFFYVLTLITDKEKHVIFGQPSIYEDPDPDTSLGLYNKGVAYSSRGG